MDENTVIKCILKSLKNNVGDLMLSISLESEEPLAEEVKYYLKLKERRSGAEDFVLLEKESPAQYSTSINIHSFPEPLEMGQTYDFYVVLGEPAAEEEEQPMQVRLSVEAEAIERAYH
ncbi:CDP-glycerol glycerophosphotransferase family protein, partial [Bacillus amyloliquefaciens]|nr:CDP-glycerol glycerophosphotransferase family protein [Bacillus amyloliquefaciens]